MKKYLITGCEGFVGSHLADLLLNKGEVYGMVYDETSLLNHLQKKIEIIPCDLKDKNQVKSIIERTKPDVVIHLAAQSFVTVSWDKPEETLQTNVMGTFYLFESIRQAGLNPVIEVIGSSSIYGPRTKEEMPMREDAEFRPTSMYAMSKVSEDMLGYFYCKGYGMNVIRVRPFNMTGPRKQNDACSDFSKEVVEVEKGIKKIVEVGNLNTIRDFTDGRDAANAMWLLSEKGVSGEIYNLCSGTGRSMKDILSTLIRLSGKKMEYAIVPEKQRLTDDPIYVGDNSRLLKLGWKPATPIEKTLGDMLDWWRAEIKV
jgi:GDP-4-dehydro-6-deoxy-D-mannose reductase